MSDGSPHIHEIKLRQRYAAIGQGPWQIEYGDQTAVVKPWYAIMPPYLGNCTPTPRRVRRAVRRAIRRHDQGSVWYEQQRGAVDQARRLIAEVNEGLRPDEWASSEARR